MGVRFSHVPFFFLSLVSDTLLPSAGLAAEYECLARCIAGSQATRAWNRASNPGLSGCPPRKRAGPNPYPGTTMHIRRSGFGNQVARRAQSGHMAGTIVHTIYFLVFWIVGEIIRFPCRLLKAELKEMRLAAPIDNCIRVFVSCNG